MSPVRGKFRISIGTTGLYPPPAAPPWVPNVGPIDGCRIAVVARLPMCLNACPRPKVVVVLPSPSGVGVTAVTTTYLAFGASASSSIADSLIFATCSPYGSSRCMPSPISPAMSSMGLSCAWRAMSRSVGNGISGAPLAGRTGVWCSGLSGKAGREGIGHPESVDLDAELGARPEHGVEQGLAGRPLAVQQVPARALGALSAADDVVAGHVGSQRRDRGPERGPVRRDVVAEGDAAQPGL